jgi:hypothetical protein
VNMDRELRHHHLPRFTDLWERRLTTDRQENLSDSFHDSMESLSLLLALALNFSPLSSFSSSFSSSLEL